MHEHVLRVAACFCLMAAAIIGCGKDESPPLAEKSQSDQAAPMKPVKEAEEPAPTPTPEVKEVDFASFKSFPALEYKATENVPGNGDVRCPLLDGDTLKNASGEEIPGYWCSIAPASFEITIPPPPSAEWHTHVMGVEVEDAGGGSAFPECVVFVQDHTGPDFFAPAGLNYEIKQVGENRNGKISRHIITFDELHASAVMIAFPSGCVQYPGLVYVKDIGIQGNFEKD
jgi:hypothetical protein